jgi:NAD(P)-dependent dehydrogenase (short-subunit alcohol dehydrogenase family)
MVQYQGASIAITGGSSGLGRATAAALAELGAQVTVIDLPSSHGDVTAKEIGYGAAFAPADVTDEAQFAAALDTAHERGGLRGVVHCAGGGKSLRLLDRDGTPADLGLFESTIRLNLVGTFNALRLGAERIAKNDPVDGERGAIVLTASAAAWEGQIGQLPYATGKAGIVGMTLVSARDLASRLIRVNTIAPGVMDTPMLARLRDDVRVSLEATVPNPSRLGRPSEFAALAAHILGNAYLNGETVRLDGAIRMAPR